MGGRVGSLGLVETVLGLADHRRHHRRPVVHSAAPVRVLQRQCARERLLLIGALTDEE